MSTAKIPNMAGQKYTNEGVDWEGSAFSSDAMDEVVDAGTAADMENTQYAELMQGLPG